MTEQVKCPKCGGEMQKRNGKYGPFWGCKSYPKCKGIVNVKGNGFKKNFTQPNPSRQPRKIENPSKYQQEIFNAVESMIKNGDYEGAQNLIVEAVAGSGKTATIEHLVTIIRDLQPDASIVYLVFNKRVQIEAQEKGLPALTTHSKYFSDYKLTQEKVKVDSNKVRDIVEKLIVNKDDDWMISTACQIIGKIKNTMCQLDNESLDELCNHYGILVNGEADILFDIVRRALLINDNQLSIVDFDDMLWLTHTKNVPVKKFDWVLADEVQDFNLLQVELVLKTVAKHAVVVGDRNQCVIDGTEILCYNKSMITQRIKSGEKIRTAVGRQNTIETIVTDVFKKKVENIDVVTIKTENGKELTTTCKHIHFAGFTNDSSDKGHFVYLMYRKDRGYRIGISCRFHSRNDLKDNKLAGYKGRLNQEKGDKIWIIEYCENEADARYWEQYYSVKYGLPTWLFHSGNGRNTAYDDERIQKLFVNLDTESGAKKLLSDKKMFIEYPHHIPKGKIFKRRNFSITLCADSRATLPLHHYAISGSDENDKKILEELGLSIRKSKKAKGWRIESVSSDLGKIYNLLDVVKSELEVNVIEKARIGNRALPFIPASHILPGMTIFTVEDDKVVETKVTSVELSKYSGYVYDFNVDRTHNYIANGIVTHNSIYAFRGAALDSMDRIKNALNAKELPLSISYRVGKAHAQLVNELFPHIPFEAYDHAEDGLVESVTSAKMFTQINEGDMVLCRINAPLVRPAFQLIREGRKAIILGRDIGKGLVTLINKFEKKIRKKMSQEEMLDRVLDLLYEYRTAQVVKLIQKRKTAAAQQLDDQVKTIDAVAEECKTLNELKQKIESIFSDDNEGIVFSSCHKMKGGEADKVYILESKNMPHPMAELPHEKQQEVNIAYVAFTRAKKELYFVDAPIPFPKQFMI